MKIILLQTSVGDYRTAFLNVLVDALGQQFLLLTGKHYFDGTTITRVDLGSNQRITRNVFMFRNRFSIQLGCFKDVLSAERAVLELNPRIITNWIFLILRRALGRRTAVWGHAWSRQGKGKGGTFLRDLMCRFAGNVIAYTENEGAAFKVRLPLVRVYVAANSLYRKVAIFSRRNADADSFIYIGRLVPEKKPQLAISAFAKALHDISSCKLVVVGDGPLRIELEKMATDLSIGEKVSFLGHIGNEDDLSALFGSAVASLSPGYVGLSVVQSFSFGTPVIVADNEPHSPEIDAVVKGDNAVFFPSDDVDGFSDAIKKVWRERNLWMGKSESIALFCRAHYSAEEMAQGFLEFANCE